MNRKRVPVLAANWKMHKSIAEAVSFARSLQSETGPCTDREVVIAPPFTALSSVAGVLKLEGYRLSAQNCHWEAKGAFTGEIAPVMLKEVGCHYVIVGHSERRHLFGETDEMIREKVSSVFGNGMVPIVCIGEVLEEREGGKTFDVVGDQVRQALQGLEYGQVENVILAYEPVWAIGTGRTASPEQAQEVHVFIRRQIEALFNKDIANKIRILYGGSVKPDNVDSLMAQPDLDGMLVGGASLEVGSFKRIIQFQG